MGSNLTKVTIELAELRFEPRLALSKALDLCYFLCIDSQVHLYVQSSGSQPGAILFPWGTFVHVCRHLVLHLERKALLASSGWRPVRLESILQPIGQPLTTKIFQLPSINNVKG